MGSMMAVWAEMDNDVRSERSVVGMKAAIAAGKWTFKAPLGYLNGDNKPGSPSLLCDTQRGPLVKQAFELFATGLHTAQKVLEIVTAAGLRTTRGKSVSKQTFNQLLRNPVYVGLLRVSGWGEPVRGDFEPLVRQEIFERAQALLLGKRQSVTPHLRNHPDFPLRHFVKCGCCGKPLTASWSKGRSKSYGNYRCHNRPCKGVNIRKENLERIFTEFLERMRPELKYVKLFNEILLDVWKEKQSQSVALMDSLNKQIEALNERKDRLEEKFIFEKTIDQETYQRQLDKLKEQIVLAEMQERDAKIESYDVESVLNYAEHVMLNAARLWAESSSDQKQRLQKVLFPQGVKFANGVIGTAETCLFFKLLSSFDVQKSKMGWPTGLEPATASSTSLDSTIELWPPTKGTPQ